MLDKLKKNLNENKIYKSLDAKHISIIVTLLSSKDYSCSLDPSNETDHLCDLNIITLNPSGGYISAKSLLDGSYKETEKYKSKKRGYTLNDDWIPFLKTKIKSI